MNMTLEQQVHQQEVTIRRLQDKLLELERTVEKLEKNSHPPVDILECICEALNSGKLMFKGSTDTGQRVYIEAGRLRGHTSR